MTPGQDQFHLKSREKPMDQEAHAVLSVRKKKKKLQ